MPRILEVIESHVPRGDGRRTLLRAVTQYHTTAGDFLAEHDSIQPHEDAFVVALLERSVETLRDGPSAALCGDMLAALDFLRQRPLGDPKSVRA